MRTFIKILPLCVLLASCDTLGTRVEDQANQIASQEQKQDNATKQYVTGAVDAIDKIPESARTPEIILAEELAKDAQSIIGLPGPGERIDINLLLSHDEKVRKAAWAVLEKKKKEDKVTNDKLQELHRELEKTKTELIELGKQKEKENHANFIKRFWAWAVGSFGLIGGIAFMVLCPTIALPIFTAILRWVISMIPQLISFVGVVGSDVVHGIVAGVEKVKENVSNAPENKTFTKDEVMKMIEGELGRTMDTRHKNVVRMYRKKIRVAKAKDLLAKN